MSYATIDDLRSQLGSAKTPEESAAYAARMLHELPEPKTVDRATFILDHCRGKRVLDFGASGALHAALRQAAAAYQGIDREERDQVRGFDLDDVTKSHLPNYQADIIVCGEVLEHLSNPGWFLVRLRRQYAGIPTIITVPNAFSKVAQHWLAKGRENVNADHVAWYSPKTLQTLLERAGYVTGGLFYYNGEGPTAEGLLVVTE